MKSTLMAGETILGILTYKYSDWPRAFYAFEPAPAYESVRAIFDTRGRLIASDEELAAAEPLDLRVIDEDGGSLRLLFIFISEGEAVVRSGLIRQAADETPA